MLMYYKSSKRVTPVFLTEQYRMLFILVLAALGTLFLWNTITDVYQIYWQKVPPGPMSLPLVGGAWAIDPSHLPKSLVNLSHRYGEIFSVRLGTQGRVVFVNSLSAANRVLMDKAASNRPVLPVLNYLSCGGYGLMVTSHGKLWRAHTRLSHTAFSQHLSSDQTIGQCLQPLWARFSDMCGKSFNPKTDIRQASFNFLWAVLFDGYNKSNTSLPTRKFMRHHDVIMETLSPTSLLHAMPSLLKFPNKWSRPLMESLKSRDEMLLHEYEKSKKIQGETMQQGRKSAIRSTMEIFVQQMNVAFQLSEVGQIFTGRDSSDMFSYNHVTQTIWGLLLAGVDTTSSALEWILLLLAAFPASADTLRNEISEVLGKRKPSLTDKSYLPYTVAWLQECLRLSSVVGLCPPHVSDKDFTLGGYTIPQGTPIIINIWAIHNNSDAWQDPENFRPARFLDDRGCIRPTWHMPDYLPYSRGTRPCVGAVLSRSFLFMFLVRFVQKFNITLMSTLDLESVTRFGQVPKPYTVVITKS